MFFKTDTITAASSIFGDQNEERKERRVVKATKKRSKVNKNVPVTNQAMVHKKVVEVYSSLLNVFSCSREHLIVGRTHEE